MITIEDLSGEWELESFTIEKPDGVKNYWGKNSHGILIYTPTGYMSVSINSETINSRPSDEERLKCLLFYAGRYEIIDDSKIVHHVMNASDANRINKDLFREATIVSQKLILTSKGDFGIASLTWRKI